MSERDDLGTTETQPYVIRIQYEKDGLRHSQMFEINADSREEAESLVSRLTSIAKVCGSRAEMDEMAKRGRHPTGEELEWAKARARDLGLM